MRELALHLLDIAENSVAADAGKIQIEVSEDTLADRLKMSVEDDGRGMDEALVARVVDPFVTSRTTRKVGLGIPLLKAAAEACKGGLTIQSALGKGTRIEVEFQRSHIDRMPLGDLGATFLTLVVGYPASPLGVRLPGGRPAVRFRQRDPGAGTGRYSADGAWHPGLPSGNHHRWDRRSTPAAPGPRRLQDNYSLSSSLKQERLK